MGIIYLGTNEENGKLYVGQSKNSLKDRLRTHKRDSKIKTSPIYNAIRKYGWEKFKWQTIYDNIPIEQLNNMEIWAIANYNTIVDNDNGYNVEPGGNSTVMSAETRKKISEATKGRIPWNKGIPRTPEEKQKMREANLGQVVSEERKLELSITMLGENNPFYGKKHTEESRNKIRAARTGTKASEETKQKQSIARTGTKRNTETKHKMSLSANKRPISVKFREARIKTYQITKPDGIIEIIKNLSQYCRDHNLSVSCMCQVSHGNQNQHKGFKCLPISITTKQ